MNRKVLLLAKEVNEVNGLLNGLLHFFSSSDKLILALYNPEGNAEWPFEVTDFGWKGVEEFDLERKLNQGGLLKKRSREKWLESSSFVDLVVINRPLMEEWKDNPIFNKTLQEIHCPIFIMDESQVSFNEIFLSYNGTASSFESIKHFTYLFHHHFKNSLLSLVVNVNETALNLENCVYDYLRLHKRHFAISRFFDEDFDQGIELLLDKCSSPLVVCGGERLRNIEQFSNYRSHRDLPGSMFLL